MLAGTPMPVAMMVRGHVSHNSSSGLGGGNTPSTRFREPWSYHNSTNHRRPVAVPAFSGSNSGGITGGRGINPTSSPQHGITSIQPTSAACGATTPAGDLLASTSLTGAVAHASLPSSQSLSYFSVGGPATVTAAAQQFRAPLPQASPGAATRATSRPPHNAAFGSYVAGVLRYNRDVQPPSNTTGFGGGREEAVAGDISTGSLAGAALSRAHLATELVNPRSAVVPDLASSFSRSPSSFVVATSRINSSQQPNATSAAIHVDTSRDSAPHTGHVRLRQTQTIRSQTKPRQAVPANNPKTSDDVIEPNAARLASMFPVAIRSAFALGERVDPSSERLVPFGRSVQHISHMYLSSDPFTPGSSMPLRNSIGDPISPVSRATTQAARNNPDCFLHRQESAIRHVAPPGAFSPGGRLLQQQTGRVHRRLTAAVPMFSKGSQVSQSAPKVSGSVPPLEAVLDTPNIRAASPRLAAQSAAALGSTTGIAPVPFYITDAGASTVAISKYSPYVPTGPRIDESKSTASPADDRPCIGNRSGAGATRRNSTNRVALATTAGSTLHRQSASSNAMFGACDPNVTPTEASFGPAVRMSSSGMSFNTSAVTGISRRATNSKAASSTLGSSGRVAPITSPFGTGAFSARDRSSEGVSAAVLSSEVNPDRRRRELTGFIGIKPPDEEIPDSSGVIGGSSNRTTARTATSFFSPSGPPNSRDLGPALEEAAATNRPTAADVGWEKIPRSTRPASPPKPLRCSTNEIVATSGAASGVLDTPTYHSSVKKTTGIPPSVHSVAIAASRLRDESMPPAPLRPNSPLLASQEGFCTGVTIREIDRLSESPRPVAHEDRLALPRLVSEVRHTGQDDSTNDLYLNLLARSSICSAILRLHHLPMGMDSSRLLSRAQPGSCSIGGAPTDRHHHHDCRDNRHDVDGSSALKYSGNGIHGDAVNTADSAVTTATAGLGGCNPEPGVVDAASPVSSSSTTAGTSEAGARSNEEEIVSLFSSLAKKLTQAADTLQGPPVSAARSLIALPYTEYALRKCNGSSGLASQPNRLDSAWSQLFLNVNCDISSALASFEQHYRREWPDASIPTSYSNVTDTSANYGQPSIAPSPPGANQTKEGFPGKGGETPSGLEGSNDSNQHVPTGVVMSKENHVAEPLPVAAANAASLPSARLQPLESSSSPEGNPKWRSRYPMEREESERYAETSSSGGRRRRTSGVAQSEVNTVVMGARPMSLTAGAPRKSPRSSGESLNLNSCRPAVSAELSTTVRRKLKTAGSRPLSTTIAPQESVGRAVISGAESPSVGSVGSPQPFPFSPEPPFLRSQDRGTASSGPGTPAPLHSSSSSIPSRFPRRRPASKPLQMEAALTELSLLADDDDDGSLVLDPAGFIRPAGHLDVALPSTHVGHPSARRTIGATPAADHPGLVSVAAASLSLFGSRSPFAEAVGLAADNSFDERHAAAGFSVVRDDMAAAAHQHHPSSILSRDLGARVNCSSQTGVVATDELSGSHRPSPPAVGVSAPGARCGSGAATYGTVLRRSSFNGAASVSGVSSNGSPLVLDAADTERESSFPAAGPASSVVTLSQQHQQRAAQLFHQRALRMVAKVVCRPTPSSDPMAPVADLLCDLPHELRIPAKDLTILGPPISKGTFGTVMKARWRGREVAVKWCHTSKPPALEQLRNFERELNAYWAVRHPHICGFYGSSIDSLESLFLVTEFCPNGNVFELFFDNKMVVDAGLRLRMAKQLTEVIAYLHSCRPAVVHRDIKTPNLVLDADFNLKLCDFGKTKFMYRSFLLLDDNGGSPRYMAPECFVPNGIITEKADVWSLACCIIEIFGGPIPHEEHYHNSAVIHKMLRESQGPLVPQWMHPEVRRMLKRCFDWNAVGRPSAAEIFCVLKALTPGDLVQYEMDRRHPVAPTRAPRAEQ